MHCIMESKLKIRLKDNEVKKSVHNCSGNDCGTYSLITIQFIMKNRTKEFTVYGLKSRS